MNITRNSAEKHQPERRRATRAAGVTLVELLVVLAIVALVAAVSIGALVLLPEHARARGTEAFIAKLEGRLAQRLALLDQRRGSIRTLDSTGSDFDLQLAGGDASEDAARAHVIAVIRTMRQEFPEWFYVESARTSNMIDDDGDGTQNESDEVIAGQWNPMQYTAGTLSQSFSDLPPAAVAHLQYVERIFADPNGTRQGSFDALHRAPTARAECLYMILTAGGTDTEWLSPGEVLDTDGDGLSEFVDKWGTPIQFFLWPTHYTSPLQKPGQQTNPSDPHQLLTEQDSNGWWQGQSSRRSRFETLFHSLTHPTSSSKPQGYRTHPLIISAGPDKGFGFQTDTADVGPDNIMGTLDDIGPMYTRASRCNSGQEGYGMDADNIDNHHLQAR